MQWFSTDKLIRRFQYAWIAAVGATLALRLTLFTEMRERSLLVLGYIFATWLGLMILNRVWTSHLTAYAKTTRGKKWARWARLTSIPNIGVPVGGIPTSPKPVSWLQPNDEEDDPRLASVKQQHRDFIRFALTVFITYPVMLAVLVY